MTTAFQPDAFQNNAFQIDVTPAPAGGGYSTFWMPKKPLDDDDDLLLAAWFMFMRQPYEKRLD